jgi:hypothetical protein
MMATGRRAESQLPLLLLDMYTDFGQPLVAVSRRAWLRRVVATFVFGITPDDPATYAVTSMAFLLIAPGAIASPAD